MKKVEIFTDGACSGNPGKGGWGVLLRFGENEKQLSGYSAETTNNRMEITACIEGLKALKEPCDVTLFSDSQYVVNTINKGWKKKANTDLWNDLQEQISKHTVNFVWVRGHNGHSENEICDKLATGAIAAENGI
jgi:ribonuclease HI